MLARRVARHLAAELRNSFHGADAVLGGFTSPADLLWCARYIARTKPDSVLIDTIFRAGLLSAPELSGVNSVIIAHDVFHSRHMALQSAGYSVRPHRLTREDEAAWLRGARHIAAIQPNDAARFAAMCPMQNVFTAPMPAFACPPRPALPLSPAAWFSSAVQLCQISMGCAGFSPKSGPCCKATASRSTWWAIAAPLCGRCLQA